MYGSIKLLNIYNPTFPGKLRTEKQTPKNFFSAFCRSIRPPVASVHVILMHYVEFRSHFVTNVCVICKGNVNLITL